MSCGFRVSSMEILVWQRYQDNIIIMRNVFLIATVGCVASLMVEANKITSLADWDAIPVDKTIMVKFHAPWCGHCKAMRPVWDNLARKYAQNVNVSVVDVDCTIADTQAICERNKVGRFPTIKYGDPALSLETYEGGRTFADLDAHVNTMGPRCSVYRRVNCDDEQNKVLIELDAMSVDAIQANITAYDARLKKLHVEFESRVEQIKLLFTDAKEQYVTTKGDMTDAHAMLRQSALQARQGVKTATHITWLDSFWKIYFTVNNIALFSTVKM